MCALLALGLLLGAPMMHAAGSEHLVAAEPSAASIGSDHASDVGAEHDRSSHADCVESACGACFGFVGHTAESNASPARRFDAAIGTALAYSSLDLPYRPPIRSI
ncbi:MAG: hypothetical protein WD382_11050 [Halofilum sp. (in: g-proteobacteria)]